MKLSSSCPAVASTSWSIRGSGYESFEQASLRYENSIHILHLPLRFLTKTTFASHSGYCTSLIKPAANSLPYLALIARLHSGAKLLFFCQTGQKEGLIQADLEGMPISARWNQGVFGFVFKPSLRACERGFRAQTPTEIGIF
jgi:hypothetical protein